jgi:hypothetical protein
MGPQGGLTLQIRYEKIFEKNLRTTLKNDKGGVPGGPGISISWPGIPRAGPGRGQSTQDWVAVPAPRQECWRTTRTGGGRQRGPNRGTHQAPYLNAPPFFVKTPNSSWEFWVNLGPRFPEQGVTPYPGSLGVRPPTKTAA